MTITSETVDLDQSECMKINSDLEIYTKDWYSTGVLTPYMYTAHHRSFPRVWPAFLYPLLWSVYTSSISTFRKNISNSLLMEAKEAGFSDKQIGKAIGVTEKDVRQKRIEANIKPWVKQVGAHLPPSLPLLHLSRPWNVRVGNAPRA